MIINKIYEIPNGLFPSGFPTRTLCTPLPCPIAAICPSHLILLDFTTRTIFGKEYRSLRFSLCTRIFFHSPVTSSLLDPNNLLTPYSQTPSAYVPPSMPIKHIKHKILNCYNSCYKALLCASVQITERNATLCSTIHPKNR